MPPGSSTRIKIDFAQGSDPGRDPNKQVNEDSCGYAETAFGHLIVLCDGMGGHYGGKEASRTAIATIFEVVEQTPLNVAPPMALKSAIEEAGRRVYRLGGPPENRARPGSTVVAMILHDRGADVAHVGDSRAYVIRSNQIYPLTRDHSMVQGMIDAGMLREEQAIGHPDSNKITRALGMRPEVEVDVRPEAMELFPGDILLTSSDGLTDLALGPDILGATRQALASGGVDNACTQLIAMANNRGGHDNITVQIARVTEVAPKAQTIAQAPAAGSPSNPGSPSNAGAPSSAQPPLGVPTTAPGATNADTAAAAFAPPNQAAQQPAAQLLQQAPQQAAAQAPQQAAAPASQQAAAGAPMQWAPVPPTTTDAGANAIPQQAPRGVSPTAPGAQGEPGPTWAAQPAQPVPQNPAPYAVDPGVAALQLAPQGAAYGASPQMPPQGAPYGAPQQMPPQGAPYGAPQQAPMMQAPAAYGPPPGAMQAPEPPPSKGGIVYLIVGLSVAAAILLVLLIWAFFLR